jgi:hypothetical protein
MLYVITVDATLEHIREQRAESREQRVEEFGTWDLGRTGKHE